MPVLLRGVLETLSPRKGETVLDVTLGLGGHAEAFLKEVGESGRLIGVEADLENLEGAKERLQNLKGSVEFHHANFRDIGTLPIANVDIVFADLGLSSPHVDDPTRGFTFREDAPLDLRFDRSKGVTARELVDTTSEPDLARIFSSYGELKQAHKIARAIKEAGDVKTTQDLKACVDNVCGLRTARVLPQVFQALRIAVNDELGALEVLLREAPALLNPSGRIGVISYHSLEDRMVKQAFRNLVQSSRDERTGGVLEPAKFKLLTKKPVRPSEQEVRENPRARSARFRAIEHLSSA